MSLPLWERGLKLQNKGQKNDYRLSLPLWERGLKWDVNLQDEVLINVAPLVGAWIEISSWRSTDL